MVVLPFNVKNTVPRVCVYLTRINDRESEIYRVLQTQLGVL